MDSSDSGNEIKARKEREETDASLLAERTKTDGELAKNIAVVEEKADRVIEVARDRAETILRDARQLADRDLAEAGASSEHLRSVEKERSAQDGALAEARTVADARLETERAEHQRALSALLRLEREATDDGLLVERAHADEVVSTRDDFLGMVSHDLRNMLGGIALSASALAKASTRDEDGDSGAVTLKHAERIQRSAARMNRLVGDLLDVVSLEAGKLHVTPQEVDVGALAKEVAEAYLPSFAAQGITFTTETPPERLFARCDHDRINQVMTNLLGNALKFTDKGARVTVSVVGTESEVRFSVIDTGVGIPEGHSLSIFERFRQVGTKDRRGLGLGLYIAKSIVEAHGGTIWAESPDGGGAALIFTLPRGLDRAVRKNDAGDPL